MNSTSMPKYFHSVEQKARENWDLLESRPDLAAPTHMLFEQVQSPRHVLSELLQNADDAGATFAKAYISENTFYFEHDGEDFDEASFSSLCSFALSNKRHLHTIGFRGIGFKSTFSLGPRVELYTPTLTVSFDKERFTQPVWIKDAKSCDMTRIRIAIDTPEKADQLDDSLTAWLDSAAPLLFFENIQRLEIKGQVVQKKHAEVGPIPNSEWIWLAGSKKQKVLRITSQEEEFPEECVAEVRKVRGSLKFELPPCSVELIFGFEDDAERIFVVLPTEVKPELPFSCNAPFIQDPSRERILDPSQSLTNRWLLRRIGSLAASSMQTWLANESLTLSQRAMAYDLLPAASVAGHSLDADCARIIVDAFRTHVQCERVLLCEGGKLSNRDKCLGAPSMFLDVWTPKELVELFGKEEVLARHITARVHSRLGDWGWLDSLTTEMIDQRLRQTPYPPRPSHDDKLVSLWNFLNKMVSQAYSWQRSDFAIVPVKGRSVLYPTSAVHVINSNENSLTDSDWMFLAEFVLLVDPDWVKLMTPPQGVEKSETEEQHSPIQAAMNVFKLLELGKRTSVYEIVDRASQALFTQDPGNKGIMLAHIAARANVSVPQSFKYLCCDNQWHQVTEAILSTSDGQLSSVLPENWESAHLIHPDYESQLPELEKQQWRKWVLSPRSSLHRFPIPVPRRLNLWGRASFESLMGLRGATHRGYFWQYHFKVGHFYLNDFDFDAALWSYWEHASESEDDFWVRVFRGILLDFGPEWERRSVASADDVSQKLNTTPISFEKPPIADWIYTLRSKKCLLDNYSNPALPSELMVHNADTVPLERIGRFVHWEIDRPENQKLLGLLGIRTKPDSADSIIERIKAFAGLENPPTRELSSLYEALDQVLARLDHIGVSKLQGAFSVSDLIFASDGTWQNTEGLFQRNDDDIPGVLTVHPQIGDLPLWDHLGVPKHPTLDLAINWIVKITSGVMLSAKDRERVSTIMRRTPRLVWERSQHWLSLSDRWTHVRDLRWKAEKKPAWRIFPSVGQATADLSMLTPDSLNTQPFSTIPSLEGKLEHRIQSQNPSTHDTTKPSWLSVLAHCLMRVDVLNSKESHYEDIEAQRILHETAERLLYAHWQITDSIQVIPFLDGQPAGDAFTRQSLWQDDVLFTAGDGPKHYRELVQAISSRFQDPEVQAAIAICVSRTPEFIEAYFAENFKMVPPEQTMGVPGVPIPEPKVAPEPGIEEKKEDYREIEGTAGDKIPDGDDESERETILDEGTAVEGQGDGNPEPHISGRKPVVHNPSHRERMGLYLKRFGFRWDPVQDCYLDGHGNSVRRSDGILRWTMYDTEGNAQRRFWLGDRSLEQGVDLNTELWEALKMPPHNSWLILPDRNEEYQEYNWVRLNELLDNHFIRLFPATYRLRSTLDHKVE